MPRKKGTNSKVINCPTDQEVFELKERLNLDKINKQLNKPLDFYGKVLNQIKFPGFVNNPVVPCLGGCHWTLVDYLFTRGLITKKNNEWLIVGHKILNPVLGSTGIETNDYDFFEMAYRQVLWG